MSSATQANARLLTPVEAAQMLTLRESTVREYARRGIIPSIKLGRHMRFFERDLLAYLEGLRQPHSR